MFSYWVDLADPITFTGGEKYLISIQGIGTNFPESYWGVHYPIVLHELVWKSSYFGYPEWINWSEVWGTYSDYCFQLIGDGEPVVPDLDCDGTLCWTDVEPGAIVNSTFMVINNGDVGSMLRWEVLSVPDWGTNWTLNWTREYLCSTNFGFVGTTMPEEIIVEVKAPEDPNEEFEGEIVLVNSNDPDDTCIIDVSLATPVNQQVDMHPLFQRILERFPNAFPILRHLMEI